MSNTTLAYYKVKSPASILNSRYRFFGSSRQPVSPFIRAASGLSLRAIALRLSITALILLLTGLAQAQRPAAATHIVKPGESLGKIADAYGVSLRELQAENNIWNWLIYAGQELAIPAGASPPEVQDFPTASNETSGITHTVLFGESLSTIASAYGVSLSELRTLNDVWTSVIYVGQVLDIPTGATPPEVQEVSPAPAPSAGSAALEPPTASIETSGMTHTVLFGESLSKIAAAYGVSLSELRTLNDVWTSVIYVGQVLDIPAGATPPEVQEVSSAPAPSAGSPAPEPSSASIESSGISHTVLFGESLSKIAEAYGVSLSELRTLNDAWSSTLYVGHVLEIPAGATPPEIQDVSPAPPPAQPPAEPPSIARDASPSENPSTHTVQRGETLFRIARRYDISVNSLMSINGIQDAARIHAGNILRLVGTTASAPPAASNNIDNPVAAAAPAPAPVTAPAAVSPGDRERYIVKRGDFLTQLAIDMSTSWIALAKVNNLADPNNLHVGATLLIPKREDVELYDPKYAAWKWFDMIAHQPGPRVGVGREIVIVLGTQSAYAYENGVLQKAARVSAGKKATPTIQGDHEIWLKRRSQTMSGPSYSLDNVEWVMYFYRDYAIHGAWWHMNFGQPMSHGCVNLTNTDAQWFYNFASIGTPVYVRA